MAKKRGTFGKLLILAVLALAVVGGYTLWHSKPAEDGVSAAKRTAEKAAKAVQAAEKAWK